MQACEEARRHGFAAVCVRSNWAARAARALAGTGVEVVATVDFPEGNGSTEARAREARAAAAAGAGEIDVVLGRAALQARDHGAVLRDLAAVVAAARVPVKVILETSRLTREEKVAACALAQAAGAAWVKTSTGLRRRRRDRGGRGAPARLGGTVRGGEGLRAGSAPPPTRCAWSAPGPTASAPAPGRPSSRVRSETEEARWPDASSSWWRTAWARARCPTPPPTATPAPTRSAT